MCSGKCVVGQEITCRFEVVMINVVNLLLVDCFYVLMCQVVLNWTWAKMRENN